MHLDLSDTKLSVEENPRKFQGKHGCKEQRYGNHQMHGARQNNLERL